jgi:hypothetical protein
MRLTAKIRDAAARAGSGVVLLFCDEAQRLNQNAYEWLRDVHDALDRQQIKFLAWFRIDGIWVARTSVVVLPVTA